jgi:hypothetical protein
MASIKKSVTRKAVALTAKHSARGATSKLKRDRVRSLTLLGVGGTVGALAGWAAARGGAASPDAGS